MTSITLRTLGRGLATTALLAMAAPAVAQSEDAAPSPLGALYGCTDLPGDAARLDCFDREIAALRARETAREVVAIDAEVAKELKRDSFGLSLPSLPKLKLPRLGGDGDAEEVRLAVKTVRKRGHDWVVETENGQVWVQTSGRLNYVPKGDLEAIIEEGALGSYRLKLTNGKTTVKGLKVRRVQ